MTATASQPTATPHAAPPDPLLQEALAGLAAQPKTLPCKLLYDERGSQLFDRICDLPEYYLTRTEAAILTRHARDIAQDIPTGATMIELGSGSSRKTRTLLDHASQLDRYVPVDISREHLAATVRQLQQDYPHLEIRPVVADYCEPLDLDATLGDAPRVLFFPGSTLGNFNPPDAQCFLRQLARLAGPEGSLILGVDLRKPPEVLLPAYDDGQGVTAAFNRNLLHRLNREYGANFDPDAFEHLAVWDDRRSRIEMHLASSRPQCIHLAGHTFAFATGETIHTESSYKHTLPGFAHLAASAGWRIADTWTDDRQWFSVQRLTLQ